MINIITALLNIITCKDNRNKEDIDDIKLDIRMIKENHLAHLERDVAEIKTDIKLILMKIS